MRAIVIGGGWAGIAAAITARLAGAEVEIFEKTDMLLGLGNVGGIIRNNGRYTALEEIKALGLEELVEIIDGNCRHKNVDFPGHKHASLYDVNRMEVKIHKYIESIGVKVHLISRVVDANVQDKKLTSICLANGDVYDGDVFIETTGSTGPMGNCLRYGNGCSMCILRCPSFGPRVSITSRVGVEDLQGERDDDVLGAFSGSCKLAKESLSQEIVDELNSKGVVVLKVPEEDVDVSKLKKKVCQQYALKEFAENVVLLDTGHAKLMTSYYPLQKLRKIKGLEYARYVDPYSGGKGNSIRYLSVAPRTNDMKVKGIDNLFVGGEKSGLFVGHTEAVASGSLAGYNAVFQAFGHAPLKLPRTIAIGDIIAYANEKMETKEGRRNRYTFAGAEYFQHMKEVGLYTLDVKEIEERIEKAGLRDVFKKKIV
ncbi:FAD-dependent oxidoreductase [Clostridium oryzae]|uniref:tRNA uridine 5-carboxymethylaminomethyl modification enzyme MnmG n=1 Tax=Clostridium oryzae TaxID=1450648 RepID=A0A1V4ITP7_9CLOT|nr:FAD-dependent oxidoreductase [Clostridium oryzae]OPJ63180.1 tRNA uridine 5-carboxymethylaminomethyl modification enzyme MnmG [Clostridium oryzae]